MEDRLEMLKRRLDRIKTTTLKKMLSEIPLKEIIEAWNDFDTSACLRIFSQLPLEDKVILISSISPAMQETLIAELSEDHSKILLEEMEPDDLADFIQSVSADVRKKVWGTLSDAAKEETRFLLKYDEDDAAGLMTPRYMAVSSSLTVGKALAWVRKGARNVEIVSNIYVVDRMKRLIGVVSLKDLLAEDDDIMIERIMVKRVISVREDTDQEEAAQILETHDLISLPVVDRYDRLLGIITFDDIIDVIREEQTEDIYRMGAMSGTVKPYLESSVFTLVKKRIPWITVLLVAATLTTNLLSHFESLFVTATVLTLFIPTIIGTGGNSGTQSSTLIIRGLATGELHFHDIGKVFLKEIFVGLAMGISMGVLIIIRSVFLPPFIEFQEALSVGAALSLVILVATLVGAFAPLLLSRLGLDPTVMAAPLMATLIDIAGLTIYFLTAKLLLGLN